MKTITGLAVVFLATLILAAPATGSDVQTVRRSDQDRWTQLARQSSDWVEMQRVSDNAAKPIVVAEEVASPHVGSNYGGGIVFYVDGTGHGLIAATSDQGRGTWYDAKKLCSNYRGGGYSDWFMPRIDQLQLLYIQRNVVGSFDQGSYWSSTERAGGAAYNGVSSVSFSGTTNEHTIDNTAPTDRYIQVRAIRSF
jgi:hypothetical protein